MNDCHLVAGWTEGERPRRVGMLDPDWNRPDDGWNRPEAGWRRGG